MVLLSSGLGRERDGRMKEGEKRGKERGEMWRKVERRVRVRQDRGYGKYSKKGIR